MKNVDNEFIYKNIFPVKIISSGGNVVNAEELLKEKILQITTNEPDCMVLSNMTADKNAYVIFDFGKEINAKLRILTYTADGADYADLRITYGESVSEALSEIGYKGATNDHSIRDFKYSFPSYSDMSLNESGFRFVKIELINKKVSVRIKSVVAVSSIRNIEYLGSFRCDNDVLNKIYDTAAYTCHLNMQQYIWDGIKRDRLVWVGDMHPEMLAVRTIFGNHNIISNSLRFMRESTPLPQWMNGMPTYSLWWIIILWDWYYYTGDRDFLAENKEYAINLIEIICNLVNKDGTDNLPSYFLDWPCNNKKAGISGSRALLAYCYDKAQMLCCEFGLKILADDCKLKKDYLLKTKANSYGAKQVEAFYSLSSWVDKLEAGNKILEKGCHGFSTFMSYYLLKSAAEADMTKALNALEEYYGAMLKMGATTFWEDFDITWVENSFRIDEIPRKGKKDIHGDFGAFCYKGLRHSLCHGWASGPVAFLAEEVLGIKILSPGCKKVKISPKLGKLKFAEGAYPTPHGLIKIKAYRDEAGKTITMYEAPDDIEIIL